MSPVHPLTRIGLVEQAAGETARELDLDLVVALRFYAIRHRGSIITSSSGSPTTQALDDLDERSRQSLAEQMRRVADVLDPPAPEPEP